MATTIIVEQLFKSYGTTIAVNGISFEVDEGEIFGMVGPNGAGKTTTIECLEGLRKPDGGQISVLGVNPQAESRFLHLHTGMQLQQSNLPERMKVWEALDLYGSFYPTPANWSEILVRLGLEEKRNTPFAKLSGGQKQRLFIALALLPDPQLIFLDELTTGLDPQARRAIWELVRDIRSKGKTILMTTHFMEEAEKLCDRVAIIDHGKIVALDTPQALVHAMGGEERITFTVEQPISPAFTESVGRLGNLEIDDQQVIIHGDTGHGSFTSDVVALLGVHRIQFRDLHLEQPNLEDVFLKLTGREMKD